MVLAANAHTGVNLQIITTKSTKTTKDLENKTSDPIS